jgi:hypothetical protein
MLSDFTPSSNEEVVLASPTPVPPRKKLSRRKVLALAGTGTLVLVIGGGAWRAADQGVFSTGEGPAYEPWDDWRTATKGPLNLVRAAILAANPHNTQPWLFQVTPSQINLFADRRRNIGANDPFLREMHSSPSTRWWSVRPGKSFWGAPHTLAWRSQRWWPIQPGTRCWLSASATPPTKGCAARAGGWAR